jgi:siroheme synthase (precorrin-2 oxidase/ferrochelatase)
MVKDNKERLLELRKKKAQNKLNQHKEIVDGQVAIKDALVSFGETISGQAFDWDQFKEHIESLKGSMSLNKDVGRLEAALNSIQTNALKASDITEVMNSVKTNDSKLTKEVINAVNDLKVNLETNTMSQKPEDFQPVRRVRKVGSRLIFDDDSMQVNVSGGGGGGIQTNLIRDDAVAVVNPDGTEIGDPPLAVRLDDSSTANTTYIGKAETGADPGESVWQISKLDTSSGLIKTWADGSASFSQVWDDRTSLTYS